MNHLYNTVYQQLQQKMCQKQICKIKIYNYCTLIYILFFVTFSWEKHITVSLYTGMKNTSKVQHSDGWTILQKETTNPRMLLDPASLRAVTVDASIRSTV